MTKLNEIKMTKLNQMKMNIDELSYFRPNKML